MYLNGLDFKVNKSVFVALFISLGVLEWFGFQGKQICFCGTVYKCISLGVLEWFGFQDLRYVGSYPKVALAQTLSIFKATCTNTI